MTSLRNEVEHLEKEAALALLRSVSYKDLKLEYWLLAKAVGAPVDIPNPIVSSLPSDAFGDVTAVNAEDRVLRLCITEDCNNLVSGRVKKCEECKSA